MRIFNFEDEAMPISDYPFPRNSIQKKLAEQMGTTKILFWPRDCGGKLPKYAQTALSVAGFKAYQIGRTTHCSNTFGLVPMANVKTG